MQFCEVSNQKYKRMTVNGVKYERNKIIFCDKYILQNLFINHHIVGIIS